LGIGMLWSAVSSLFWAGAKWETARTRLMIRQVPGTKVCRIAQQKLKPGGSKSPPLLHLQEAVVLTAFCTNASIPDEVASLAVHTVWMDSSSRM